MAIKLHDGSNVQFSDLLNGNAIDPDTGKPVVVSRVGQTNTYTATVTRSDGKKFLYSVDKPTDVAVTVSKKVID
jgi:hypothetical protein